MAYFFDEPFQNGTSVEREDTTQVLQFGGGVKTYYKTNPIALRSFTFTNSYYERDYKRVYGKLDELCSTCESFYCFDPLDTSKRVKVICRNVKVVRETRMLWTITAEFKEVLY